MAIRELRSWFVGAISKCTGVNAVMSEVRSFHPALPQRVEVIDCTLRDGEQSPGVAFTVDEKVELGAALLTAGIRTLDAGFPAASGADREAMQALRRIDAGARIGATARAVIGDVNAAAAARATDVFLFMPTSDARLAQTLRMSRLRAELLLLSSVEAALGHGMNVSVVFEDATRADSKWMMNLVETITRRVHLERVILADSVGRSYAAHMERLFGEFVKRFGDDVAFAAHCHNDFGLATANTLAAVAAGARAITCTVNGIGERAGNADLAETVAALTHLYGVEHGVEPLRLPDLSRRVELISGIHMSAIKPITGFNVFRHESGVHVDAMLKDTNSYEFLPARWVGSGAAYVLGKHSGLALVRKLLEEAGIEADEGLAKEILAEAKRTAEMRDKGDHARAYAAHVDTQHQLLQGLDLQQLIRARSGQYLKRRIG